MSPTETPSTERQNAGRAFTKRIRWAGEFQFLSFFLAIAGYGSLGLHQRADAFARALTHNFYLQIAFCWVPLWAVCTTCTLPVTCYIFHLQRKFGLATAGLRDWLWDSLKANALSLILGGALIEIAFASHKTFPSFGWICAGLLSSLLFLGITRSLPWILSLFYPVVPLGDGSLRERLARLAKKAGIRAGTIYEWRVSRRTRQANALITGVGAARRILLTDTLISGFSEEEVEALVAHEFGHFALHHTAKRLLLQGLIFSAIFYCVNFAVHNGLVWFADESLGWADLKLLPGLYLYWSCGRVYGNFALGMLSRKQEKAADLYSWKLIGRAEPFITGMRKLSDLNLLVFDKSSEWKYSHPATSERLAAAEQFAKANGEITAASRTAVTAGSESG
jgi:STE24 endopeptidase